MGGRFQNSIEPREGVVGRVARRQQAHRAAPALGARDARGRAGVLRSGGADREERIRLVEAGRVDLGSSAISRSPTWSCSSTPRRVRGRQAPPGRAGHDRRGHSRGRPVPHVLLPWAVLERHRLDGHPRPSRSARASWPHRRFASSGSRGRSLPSWCCPVLVIEQIGPIQAVKRSAGAVQAHLGREHDRQRRDRASSAWSRSMVGVIPCLLLISVGGPVAVIGIVALSRGSSVCSSWCRDALTGIFQIALYRFANDGTVPGFDNDKLREAFRPRSFGAARRLRWLRRLRRVERFQRRWLRRPARVRARERARPRLVGALQLELGPAPGAACTTHDVGSRPVRAVGARRAPAAIAPAVRRARARRRSRRIRRR